MIEFLCPNGHRIHCSRQQAGRAAKCPRCGVKFRVPHPAEAMAPDKALGDSDVSEPQWSDSGSAIAETPTAQRGAIPAPESLIEFLCPNGHRLHGPAELQGRPGECPECGSKFRVPNYDDVAEEDVAETEEIEEVEPQLVVDGPDGSDRPGAPPAHSLAGLFARLWAEKPSEAAIELQLADGKTLVPDRFAKDLSRQDHAVFAVKEPGGTHTLTVVAWASIVRVQVRGVTQLPQEMSE